MNKIVKSQKGQALIELIIFLPLMVTLYSVIGGFAGSINGSINQQKVTRAYFYYRIQNNSNIPGLMASAENYEGWKQFGMFYIGWKDYFKGEKSPVMPCYKIAIPFKDEPTDKCDEEYSKDVTLWVRVGTIYGVCGATLVNQNNETHYAPDYLIDNGSNFSQVIDRNSCLITQ